MSLQSKYQLPRPSASHLVNLKPFQIVLAPHLVRRLKHLCTIAASTGQIGEFIADGGHIDDDDDDNDSVLLLLHPLLFPFFSSYDPTNRPNPPIQQNRRNF